MFEIRRIDRSLTHRLVLLNLSTIQSTLTTLLMAYTSFFALSNSNAISSIDLSNAYNGVSGYNVGAVGVLLFLSNWAGPIWWSSAGILLFTRNTLPAPPIAEEAKDGGRESRRWVQEERENLRLSVANGNSSKETASTDENRAPTFEHPSPFFTRIGIYTVFTSTALVAVMAACTALRTHLFIWTVFSPKYLYAMAWCIAFHLGISVGLESVMWATRLA